MAARLRIKLSLFNILSKVVFSALFLLVMPILVKRISLVETDNSLIAMREKVISLIERIGIEPFIASEPGAEFGSYNILKGEFISIERFPSAEDVNYIEVSARLIENEEITYRMLNYSFKIEGSKYLLVVGRSLESIHQTEGNTRRVMLLFLAFIILITFITDFLYTRKLLKPLDVITGRLKDISDPSSFDKTPVKTTTTDFTELDNALKELMERIEELFRKEKETTVNISHELLTPVSVLRSKLENLLVREDLKPESAIRIDESLKTLHRLQSLVNSLLLISRIESRQYLRDESISINELLSEIISELDPIAEDSGISMQKNFINDSRTTRANRSLLFSMFYNVINNALKNSPRESIVAIGSSSEKSNHIVTITDYGKGLSESQLTNLFLRFKTRGDSSGNGTGIGLAITKSIADFHGIKISVISELNKGTVFSFIFPETS